MSFRENLLNALSEKINQEYDDWKSGVLKLSAEEIYQRAGEIAIKEETIEILSLYLFKDCVLQTLILCDNVLDEIYAEWCGNTESLIDDLKEAILDFVSKV
jgi:hypothetical protein